MKTKSLKDENNIYILNNITSITSGIQKKITRCNTKNSALDSEGKKSVNRNILQNDSDDEISKQRFKTDFIYMYKDLNMRERYKI